MVTVIQRADAQLDPRRWWALGALVASMLVLGFDLTILNVALPTMAEQLGASTGELQWVVDAYIVVFAALMLPTGLLGDRFGRRRMLIAGLAVFLAGSLLGVLVDTPELVVAARAVMGVGAALVIPLGLSVLPSMLKLPAHRGFLFNTLAATLGTFVFAGLLFVLPTYFQRPAQGGGTEDDVQDDVQPVPTPDVAAHQPDGGQ